jgi:nucleoside recognition membrane protein YjiH
VDLSNDSTSEQATGKTFSKAGVMIFLATYLFLIAIALIMVSKTKNAPACERRILYAVLAAIPFLAVRFVYTIIASFSSLSQFNIRTGNPIIQLVMVTLEELAVALMYTTVGLLAPREKRQTAADKVAMRYQGGEQDLNKRRSDATNV